MPYINTHFIQTPPRQILEVPLENETIRAEPSEADLRLASRRRQAQGLLATAQRTSNALTQCLLRQATGDFSREASEATAAAQSAQWLAEEELKEGLQFLALELEVDMPDLGFGDAEPIMTNPHDHDASGLVWGSSADFYKQIAALLGALQSEWLARFQEAMGKFVEFYAKLSEIMERLVIDSSNDKGDVTFDLTQVVQDLERLMAEYGMPANGLAKFDTQADAEAFMHSLGMPGLTVAAVPGNPTRYAVMMDLTAVKSIVDGTPKGRQTWNSARYAAWQDAKNLSMERLNQASKLLQEKLSDATQKYNRAVEILSATIDKIGGVDRLVSENVGR